MAPYHTCTHTYQTLSRNFIFWDLNLHNRSKRNPNRGGRVIRTLMTASIENLRRYSGSRNSSARAQNHGNDEESSPLPRSIPRHMNRTYDSLPGILSSCRSLSKSPANVNFLVVPWIRLAAQKPQEPRQLSIERIVECRSFVVLLLPYIQLRIQRAGLLKSGITSAVCRLGHTTAFAFQSKDARTIFSRPLLLRKGNSACAVAGMDSS